MVSDAANAKSLSVVVTTAANAANAAPGVFVSREILVTASQHESAVNDEHDPPTSPQPKEQTRKGHRLLVR
jgi:hypothetical protein